MMFHTCFNINTELFRAMMDFDDVIRCGPSFRRMEVFLRIYLLNNSEGFHEFMATTKNQPVIYIYIYTYIYNTYLFYIHTYMYIYIYPRLGPDWSTQHSRPLLPSGNILKASLEMWNHRWVTESCEWFSLINDVHPATCSKVLLFIHCLLTKG